MLYDFCEPSFSIMPHNNVFHKQTKHHNFGLHSEQKHFDFHLETRYALVNENIRDMMRALRDILLRGVNCPFQHLDSKREVGNVVIK